MTYSLTEGQLDLPADSAFVEGVSFRLGVTLPSDYLDFLRQHDGGEGLLGITTLSFGRPKSLRTSTENMGSKSTRLESSCSALMAEGKDTDSTPHQRQRLSFV